MMKSRFLFMIGFLCLLSNIALQAEIQYLHPIPGSENHPKETVLIIRFNDTKPEDITNLHTFISVSGDKSGDYDGRIIRCNDGKTINYQTSDYFKAGEKITVRLTPQTTGFAQAVLDTSFSFTIKDQQYAPTPTQFLKYSDDPFISVNANTQKQNATFDPIIRNGISIPSDFPWVDISIKNNPDSGYIFLNNWGGPPYNMILDNDGNPIWYWKTDDRQRDFKVQPDGRLTMRVREGYGGGGHIALDSTYSVVDTFFAPPGYAVDEHELQVRPNGNYYIIALEWQIWDMSDIVPGGNPSAIVVGNHVVEMDADDNPLFIWRCWDNYTITDAVHEDLTAGFIDYIHMNAIEVDLDGNLLVSCRHMDEITKVNRQTGRIMWRLGGVNDDFAWDDPDRITYQHDIRVLSNGNYTIFDNGNHHDPSFSRAIELKLDTLYWTASTVWEFRDNPDKYTWWMGNVQRLPSGNTLINWADGSLPKVTEVAPDGTKELELNFENGAHCYRVFKFPWKGKAIRPYLILESYPDRITLLFNKFGDEDISHYNIYGGKSPNPDQVIATSHQPFVHLYELDNLSDYYFRVTAVNSSDDESEYSNEEHVFVNIIPPGENMVVNGDFSDGFNYWNFYVEQSEASADHLINSSGELEIQISSGGSSNWHVQALYPNLVLVEGSEYLFEFDAYATQNRYIQAELEKDGNPWTNYSKMGLSYITQEKQRFSRQFIMEEPTDFNSRIVFNVGAENTDIFIDNVSLRGVVTNLIEDTQDIPPLYFLGKNYPNPFNPITTFRYHVPYLSHVSIVVYTILGESVKTVIDKTHHPGVYALTIDGSDLSSGLYFYQMAAQSIDGSNSFKQVRKLVILK